MKVLIACEESQAVCKAFRAKGHEAYSCDIIEPSGGHPEWHILGDAIEALKGGVITTMDGVEHYIGKWEVWGQARTLQKTRLVRFCDGMTRARQKSEVKHFPA